MVKNKTYPIRFPEAPVIPMGLNEELVLDLKIVLKRDEINKHGVVNRKRP